MELHLTPEQETRLAAEDEREIVRQRTEQAIRIGLAQADAGEFIEEEEMDKRVKAMLAR